MRWDRHWSTPMDASFFVTTPIHITADDSPLSAAIQQRDADTLQMVRQALQRQNVMLAFQPVVHAQDPSRPAFYEALIRVMDDTQRIIPAREFISTIEPLEDGRIVDCLALELGCQALQRHPRLRLSVNMSPRSITYPRWRSVFETYVLGDPTLGERLIIEITEATAIVVPELVVDFMTLLQSHGVSFALDDFGAGYTAFRYFKDFLFDMVKIDNSFIRDIHENGDSQVIVAALMSIARQFDMFVIAEGVEAPREAQYLADQGIDCLQGYLFGAPKLQITPPEILVNAQRSSA